MANPSVQYGQPLTARELQVLGLYGDGLGYVDIAAAAGIARSTIQGHLIHVRIKLGARNSAHALTLAYQANLLPVVG